MITTRYYIIPNRGEKDDVQEFDDQIIRLVNSSGQSREAVLLRCLKSGAHNEDKKEVENGTYNMMDSAIAKKTIKRQEDRRTTEGLSILLEDMGIEKFIEWGETTTEVSQEVFQAFLANHTWRNEDLRWNIRARDWLNEFLSDGEEHRTCDIRIAAIAAGIIGDTEEEWHKLRVMASRMGLTKAATYGCWCLVRAENS